MERNAISLVYCWCHDMCPGKKKIRSTECNQAGERRCTGRWENTPARCNGGAQKMFWEREKKSRPAGSTLEVMAEVVSEEAEGETLPPPKIT